jgi:hypothetical protein
VSPLLPAAGFVPAADQCSGARPRFSVPIEARLSMRPFTLRQRRPTFQSAPAARSTLLAYIFEAISGSASGPFGFALPPPHRLLWPCEARSPPETRCQIRSRNSLPVFRLSLPVGISQSLRIVALSLTPTREACPCRLPDLPSLPAAPEIITYHVSASDHRSGSATSCQACCPSNLLEPHSSCTGFVFQSSKNRT